jgi:hypothetical protein
MMGTWTATAIAVPANFEGGIGRDGSAMQDVVG